MPARPATQIATANVSGSALRLSIRYVPHLWRRRGSDSLRARDPLSTSRRTAVAYVGPAGAPTDHLLLSPGPHRPTSTATTRGFTRGGGGARERGGPAPQERWCAGGDAHRRLNGLSMRGGVSRRVNPAVVPTGATLTPRTAPPPP